MLTAFADNVPEEAIVLTVKDESCGVSADLFN
jgi:hypothetical protein